MKQHKITLIAPFLLALGIMAANAWAQNPTPYINKISPPVAVPGFRGLVTLTVNGTGYVPGAVVNWKVGTTTNALTTTFVSATELTAGGPASLFYGTASVTVVNPSAPASNVYLFQGTVPTVTKGQPPASTGAAAAIGILFAVIALLSLAFYIYAAVCLQVIAKKTNTANGWLAWIPIANVVLMLNIAQKPVWWLLLLLIPVLNIVIAVIVWMQIAKARAKAEWWGVMVVVPVMNFIAPGYLAFST
jgi:hypothetical protein